MRGFCDSHNISRAMFYKLVKQGRGPRLFKVGTLTLISRAAAAEWVAQLEREQQAGFPMPSTHSRAL